VALPSFWEGLPVALIEALSAGMPLIASSVGGNPELVQPGVNGWLVPPGDVGALTQALRECAADAQGARRMGAASRQMFAAGGFSPAEVTARHIEVYQRAVEYSQQLAPPAPR
jgi:glycosyltransferase involved in cell wall biosynthesis